MQTSTENLWQRFGEQLDRFIRRRVSNHADAEDLRQRVYLRIHQHLQQHAPPAHLSGWVHRIARNAIIDHHRRQATAKVVSGSSDEMNLETQPAIDDEIAAAETGAELACGMRLLLAMLSEQDREALRWTELEGVTQADAAERAGISLPAMKSRVQRARAKLRQQILACCEIELDGRQQPIDYRCKNARACGCA